MANQEKSGSSNCHHSLSSKTEYINQILKFIPVTVLHHLADKTPEERAVLPQCQTLATPVLVAEIKHFYDQYPLVDSLAQPKGSKDLAQQGYFRAEQTFNEHLGAQSSQFLDVMAKTIHKYGGDIVQFVGNSIIAIWPRKLFTRRVNAGVEDERTRKDRIEEDSNVIVGRKAVQCALEIKIESMKLFKGKDQIYMGVGFGECGLMHAGGVFNRVEHFLIGKGLTSALRALKYATHEQPCVVSQTLWSIVDKFFVWKQLSGSTHLPERSVEYVFGMPVKCSYNTASLRSLIDDRTLKGLQKELKGYIPAYYRPYLKLKKDIYGSEHRRVTIMIVNVEMEYNLNVPSSFQIIQKIIKIVQQQVYRMEGSFSKVISYEGGFTVMCTWGLSPMSHTDDAARAVLAALNMQKKLIYFFQVVAGMPDFSPPVHFGLCTGNVFVGISGTTQNRKELVILGDTVERTFLFMQTATKVFGRIFVDQATKTEATHHLDFQYLEHIQFADKYYNHPVFAPIDPILDYESPLSQLKPSQLIKQLRLHSNPFKLDHDNTFQHNYSVIYGSMEVIDEIAQDIADYSLSSEDTVWALAIKGPAGSGKSLFVRCLLIEVIKAQNQILAQKNKQMVEQAQNKYYAKNLTFEFVVSACNPEIAKRFIGVWIPVLRMMLEILSVSTKVKHQVILNKILAQSTAADKVEIIEEIFGLEEMSLDRGFAPQILIKNQPNGFVMVKSYPKPVEDSLIEFLTDFVKEVTDQLRDELIFFVVLDNASLMDAASWQLFESLTGCCEHFIIIMCLQSPLHSDMTLGGEMCSENFLISEHAQRYYKEHIRPIEETIFHQMEMEALTSYDLRQILLDTAEDYEVSIYKEIDLITAIIDPVLNQVKTGETQNELKNRLVQHYQVYNVIKEVERPVIDTVIQKTSGNALFSLGLIHQMIINNFVQIKQQTLLSHQRLKYGMQTDCFNNIPLPAFLQKQNSSILEQTLMGNFFLHKMPSETALCAVILLKSAAVIGNIFTLKQLRQVTQLDEEQVRNIELQLDELENRDIVELIFEDGYGDKIYRFSQRFMRETLYSMQIFDLQKKPVHTRFINYLQENMIFNWQTEWNFEKEQVLMLQNLLELNQLTSEAQLTYLQKQPLTIKRVNTAIFLRKEIIKTAEMSQQKYKKPASGSRRSSKVERRDSKFYQSVFLTLGEKLLTIYKDRLTYEYKQDPSVSMKLEDIIRVQIFKYVPGADAQKNLQNLSMSNLNGPSTTREGRDNLNDSMYGALNESSMSAYQGGRSSKKKQVILLVQTREYTKGKDVKDKMSDFIFVVDSRKEAEEWIGTIEYLKTKASVNLFINKFGGNVKIQMGDDFQPALSQYQVHGRQQNRFGEALQRQVFNQNQGQNLFQIRLYENLLQISTSKRLKKKLQEKLFQIGTQDGDEEALEAVYSLKDQLGAFYNLLQLQLFTNITDNSCKFDGEEEVTPSNLGHFKGILGQFKDAILSPFKMLSRLFTTTNLIREGDGTTNTMMLAGDDPTGQGFARMLQLDDQTNTGQHEEIHVEENQDGEDHQPDESGEAESKGEEDDIMDDEEYKRMIDQRGTKPNQVRFSMLVTEKPRGGIERRMTMFNPIDPNNATGFRFLAKNTSRALLQSIKSKSKAGGGVEDYSQVEDSVDQSLIYQSMVVVDEPQKELFDETWKLALPKVTLPLKRSLNDQEGADVLQVCSQLNDINVKALNFKRQGRRKTVQMQLNSPNTSVDDYLIFKEEHHVKTHGKKFIAVNQDGPVPTPSIGQQQYRAPNPQREQRANALAKILEQGHKRGGQRDSKNKKSNAHEAEVQANQMVSESEMSAMEDDVYRQIRKQQSGQQLRMMSSTQSIAYLQTLQEAERTNLGASQNRRDSQSRRSTISTKRGLGGKIYRPTPSVKQLPEWKVIEEQMNKRGIKIFNEDDDDASPTRHYEGQQHGPYSEQSEEDDYGDSLPSHHSSMQVSPKHKTVLKKGQTKKVNGFSPGDEVMLCYKNVQCIIQGASNTASKSIKLRKGDILEVEIDLQNLNLVQCKVLNEDRFLSVVVPRDQLTLNFDEVSSSSGADDGHSSEEEEIKQASTHQRSSQRDSREQQQQRSTSNPQNPSPFKPNQLQIEVGRGLLLKLQTRKEKKHNENSAAKVITHQINTSQQPMLKVMERKLNKMMREGGSDQK